MLGVSFIAGAFNAAENTRAANRSARGRFDHLGSMAKGAAEDPAFRKRVERIDQSISEQIAAGVEGSLPCPECQRPMLIVHAEGIELDHCIHCKGFWFDDGELATFTGLGKDVPADASHSRASRFPCPHCGETMLESAFKLPFTLLVDRCPNGHGVYCEAREFEWALGLANNHTTGPRS